MATVIKYAEMVEETMYQRVFEVIGTGATYAFECDSEGNVDLSEMAETKKENYQKCINDVRNVRDLGIQSFFNRYKEPGELRCDCGESVYLDGFTNTCDKCDADYNSSGQRLAPRCQWGEETGEHWADIARIK